MTSALEEAQERKRVWALGALCLAGFMTAVDTTITNVALASMERDLHFSGMAPVLVVNAYWATYGGFLLLGGRLGDLFGERRTFLLGIVGFTLASLVCGLARSPGLLIAGRAMQGLAGAAASAVTLSLIMKLFAELPQQAKAIGVRAFANASGGSMGLLLGGVLTHALGWHSVFFINVPIGVCVWVLSLALLPRDGRRETVERPDVAGAVTVTAALMLTIYAIVNVSQAGLVSLQTLGLLACAGMLSAVFVGIECRAKDPLIPVRLLQVPTVVAANGAGILLGAIMFTWPVILALYLQSVSGLNALQAGLAFLPANLVIAGVSLVVAPKLVIRFGIKRTFVAAAVISSAGLILFARLPLTGTALLATLMGLLALGLGNGMAYNPLLLSATRGVARDDVGAASGMIATSCSVGSAVGLAVAAGIAALRTDRLFSSGAAVTDALGSGYHAAFATAAVFAAVLGLVVVLYFPADSGGR